MRKKTLSHAPLTLSRKYNPGSVDLLVPVNGMYNRLKLKNITGLAFATFLSRLAYFN